MILSNEMQYKEQEYIDFFNKIKIFKKEQDKQKQRGLNDFNLLSTVRKYHDEVYLHSTMIGAFLNPKSTHYQNTLFIEKFLKVVRLNNFELNLENISVKIEYHDIDLYITDGNKHIIIENKIWAEDQECQIIKYINIIKEENLLDVADNIINDIYVIYLTPNDKEVSSEHKIENGYITFSGTVEKLKTCSNRSNTKKLVPNGLQNYKVKYKKIDYKNDILKWLYLCQKELENITNLNEAIKQYIDVVKMLNKNYRSKIMALSELLKNKEYFELAYDVNNNFEEACALLEKDFWDKMIQELEHINEYFGIENKLENKIRKEPLSSDDILKIRNAYGVNSEINIHFKFTKDIMLLIGMKNYSEGIFAIVYLKGWEKIDNKFKAITKSLCDLPRYNFKTKGWCLASGLLTNELNLRNKELIYANNKIDIVTKKVQELVSDLKKILENEDK